MGRAAIFKDASDLFDQFKKIIHEFYKLDKVEESVIENSINRENLEALNKHLNKLSLKFELKAGDDDKLFGSVTSQMISDAIRKQGFSVDKKEIEMPKPIKSIGKFNAFVKLSSDLESKIKIKVTAEKEIKKK